MPAMPSENTSCFSCCQTPTYCCVLESAGEYDMTRTKALVNKMGSTALTYRACQHAADAC